MDMEPTLEKKTRKHPFANMKISDNNVLKKIEGRSPCIKCSRSRKFFCYTCYLPVESLKSILPEVKIPVKIDIIKHKNEIDGKSTAAHAAVLCNNVKIYSYPDIPDYSSEEGVILIYPGAQSVSVSHFFDENIQLVTQNNFGLPKGHNMGTLLRIRMDEKKTEPNKNENNLKEFKKEKDTYKYNLNNLPIKRAVFIDATWNQSRGIYKDERICSLKSIVLQNRLSQFWRHQKGSPRWYLATVEAIHQFLLEMHVNAWGLDENYRGLETLDLCDKFYNNIKIFKKNELEDQSYNGQYDNLLFFFSHMYDLIHMYYDHNQLKSYKRPF